MKNISCLRCDKEMRHIGREKLQLGQTGWILGDLPNLFAGAIETDIYACPKCNKLEFFMAKELEESLPQKYAPTAAKNTILTILNARFVNMSIDST